MTTVKNSIDQLFDSDIALKVLIKNKNGSPTSNYTGSNNIEGQKWVDVPTNLDTMIGFKSGDPIKLAQFRDKITFLVLQKYTTAQSAQIATALSSKNKKSPDVKFSSNGTLTINGIYFNNFTFY